VKARAEELEARRRWMRLSVVALVLTVLGTVVDLQVGRWAAAFFGLPSSAVHHGLLALWIAPSFGLLVLFPMLPLLSAKGNGKGRTI
jgi:Na+/proline symporter